MTADEPNWWSLALCREVGGDMFFGDEGDGIDHARTAKAVCRRCDVVEPCLEDALSAQLWHDRFGIRAGLSPGQRARLRKGRARGLAA